ncbi:MAG: EutN/CcmL family microcompartment protein [Deltaproteobacteria bacterium]|nr:EutN/CcmL family microcompartment protein [Deltaproteobacteria bacterium]
MKVARVIGTVVATTKHPALAGHKTLLCQPLDEHGKDAGDAVIALDRAQAGIGDRVLLHDEGNGARQLLGRATADIVPIRTLVVGIVDAVDLA